MRSLIWPFVVFAFVVSAMNASAETVNNDRGLEPHCSYEETLFCEGFESGSVRGWDVVVSPGGSPDTFYVEACDRTSLEIHFHEGQPPIVMQPTGQNCGFEGEGSNNPWSNVRYGFYDTDADEYFVSPETALVNGERNPRTITYVDGSIVHEFIKAESGALVAGFTAVALEICWPRWEEHPNYWHYSFSGGQEGDGESREFLLHYQEASDHYCGIWHEAPGGRWEIAAFVPESHRLVPRGPEHAIWLAPPGDVQPDQLPHIGAKKSARCDVREVPYADNAFLEGTITIDSNTGARTWIDSRGDGQGEDGCYPLSYTE